MDRLAGRFSLLSREDNLKVLDQAGNKAGESTITVGFVGNVTAESLSYEELRYVTFFYTDGNFTIKDVKLLNPDKDKIVSKYPINNYNSIVKITVNRLYVNIPEHEYYTLKKEEEKRFIRPLASKTLGLVL